MARRSSKPKAPPSGTAAGRAQGASPAFDAGLRYLAGRAHSRLELRRKLTRKGFEEDEVEAALGRLGELGYLDDAAFARSLVRRRATNRGPVAVAAELGAKGISRDGVAAALAELDAGTQLDAATRLAERLYAEKPMPGYREMLDRIGSKLIRRGYSGSVVREACRAVLSRAAERP